MISRRLVTDPKVREVLDGVAAVLQRSWIPLTVLRFGPPGPRDPGRQWVELSRPKCVDLVRSTLTTVTDDHGPHLMTYTIADPAAMAKFAELILPVEEGLREEFLGFFSDELRSALLATPGRMDAARAAIREFSGALKSGDGTAVPPEAIYRDPYPTDAILNSSDGLRDFSTVGAWWVAESTKELVEPYLGLVQNVQVPSPEVGL